VGSQAILPDLSMQFAGIPGTSVDVSRIALGTWAIGGWHCGAAAKRRNRSTRSAPPSIKASPWSIRAPVYGFGRSEEIVGKALRRPDCARSAVIATESRPGVAATQACSATRAAHGSCA